MSGFTKGPVGISDDGFRVALKAADGSRVAELCALRGRYGNTGMRGHSELLANAALWATATNTATALDASGYDALRVMEAVPELIDLLGHISNNLPGPRLAASVALQALRTDTPAPAPAQEAEKKSPRACATCGSENVQLSPPEAGLPTYWICAECGSWSEREAWDELNDLRAQVEGLAEALEGAEGDLKLCAKAFAGDGSTKMAEAARLFAGRVRAALTAAGRRKDG